MDSIKVAKIKVLSKAYFHVQKGSHYKLGLAAL